MTQPPPPPPMSPPPGPPPPGPAGARPPLVTVAAVLLFIGGGLGVLVGLLLLLGSGLHWIFPVLGIISIGVGAAQIYAGVQIMAARERGRIMGIALAGLGALLALAQIGRSPGSAIVSILINGFVIYALVVNEAYFTNKS
jgi:hypothetical protein